MTTLIIRAEEEGRIAELRQLARANPISAADLERMSRGFNASDPATRPPAADCIPLQFTIDLPVGVRTTYTEEEQPFGLCRHFSVSIDKPGAMPAPPIVDELLACFGFVGSLSGPLSPLKVWAEQYEAGRIAINVIEAVPSAELSARASDGEQP